VSGRRFPAVLGAAALGLAAPCLAAGAQAGVQVNPGAAAATGAATHKLKLRPRPGDTLHLRFEQVVYGGGNAAAEAARGGKVPRILSSMTVLSRSIVEQGDMEGSTIVAHTDSVVLRMVGAAPESLERARRAMQGRATRMRVAHDGAMSWSPAAARRGDTAGAAGGALGLPGALPPAPVAVGASWTRTMPLPWADGGAVRGEAPRLQVTFRLDSVSRGGALAYPSRRGRLLAGAGAAARVGGASVSAGTAEGAMRLDLARGWIVDSRADFALDVLPVGATPPGQLSPAPMRLRIAQRLTAR
jgi:hypothetical protein